MLPSSNLIPSRSMVVTQATTKGLLAPIPYGCNTGDDTMTLEVHLLGRWCYRVVQFPSYRVFNPVPDRLSNQLSGH